MDSTISAVAPPPPFALVPLHRVPPAAAAELRDVFADLACGRPWLSSADVRGGFSAAAAASVGLSASTLSAAVAAMVDASVSDAGSTAGADAVCADAFVRGAYALSLRSRALRQPAVYAVFPDSAFTSEAATGCLRARRRVWTLLDDAGSSPAARTLASALGATVLLSVATFLAESNPGVRARAAGALTGIDIACAVIFLVEYVARLACAPAPAAYAVSFFGLVDLAALSPLFIELIAAAAGAGAGAGDSLGTQLLRALRLVRLLRLFKLGRHVAWLRVFGATLRRAAPPLAMLLAVVATTVLVWSTLAYVIERGTWDAATETWLDDSGAPSAYSSVPASAWWAVVSMTGVGYGEVTTITPPGQVLSFFTIMSGIILASIPIGIITGTLAGEAQAVERVRALRAEHAAAAAADTSKRSQTLDLPAAAAPAAGAPAAATAAAAPPSTAAGSDASAAAVSSAQAVAAAAAAAAETGDACWSEPFLKSMLLVVRASRRRYMSALKKLELANREKTVAEVEDFVADLAEPDRAEALRRSVRRGVA